ncbi:RNA-binding domain-containing protein [Rhodococcus sp. As11]|uniref:RNA-binding domain-containing protein n=1 Tax=Rhodococcus sp. As11 TaxID=3029189 RepID=UPI003B813938
MTVEPGKRRTTRNPVVLQKLEELAIRYPESRSHRNALRDLNSDFVYAAPVRDDKRFHDVWIVLVRLAPELEDRFGIHREILGIYTPHADLQGRTIRRIPELFAMLPIERRGIARHISFVWSSDSRLHTKLDQLSQTELVLIPFVGYDGDSLLHALAGRLYAQDLYQERKYVTGDQFFGRRPILQALRADLRNQQISGLFGTRKTGKTSILKELVATSKANSDETLREVYVYIDLEDLSSVRTGDPIAELIEDVSEKIRIELKEAGARTKEISEVSFDTTIREFRTALAATLQHRDNSDISLVIILDEIEHLCPPDHANGEPGRHAHKIPQFFGVLRKLVQELDNFNFAIAGLAPAIIEIGELYGRPNPLYSVATPYYLSPFDRGEAAELLNGIGARIGLIWNEEAINAAFNETGGQVILLRELGSRVWRTRAQGRTEACVITSDDIRVLLRDYRRSVRSQIDETMKYIQQYYPNEYALAQELIENRDSFNELVEQYEAESDRLINLGLATCIAGVWEPSRLLEVGLTGQSYSAGNTNPQDQTEILDEIRKGEGSTIEFKSSIRVPLGKQVEEVAIVESFIKTIAGFLNSNGGTLYLGIGDSGEIIGLEEDVNKCGNEDALLRFTVDKINSYLGNVAGSIIRPRYADLLCKRILIVDVPRSDTLVFPKKQISGKTHQLYVRQGANTKLLEGQDIVEFSGARTSSDSSLI